MEDLKKQSEELVQALASVQQQAQTAPGSFAVFQDVFALIPVSVTMAHPLRQMIGGAPFVIVARNTPELAAVMAEPRARIAYMPVGAGGHEERQTLTGAEPAMRSEHGCQFKDVFPHTKMEPVSTDEARLILSLFQTASAMDAAAWPVWVLTEGAPAKYLGASKGAEKSMSIFSVETEEATAKAAKSLPKLDALLARCLACHRLPNDAKVSLQACATYDVLGVSEESGTESAMLLHFTWEDVAQTLSPPPFSAQSVLRIRAVPGDRRSAAHSLYKELQTLLQLTMRLDNLKAAPTTTEAEEMWPADNYICHPKIPDFLARLETGAETPLAGANDDADLDAPIASIISPRVDLDFTELLWEFAREASCYTDLRMTMSVVLKLMQQGSLKPMIHRTNHSLIAKVALECMRVSRGVTPSPETQAQLLALFQSLASVLKPVECLVEIGLCKLRRDYTHHLMGQELATSKQLEFFVDETVPLTEQANRAARLHNVLELFVLAKGFADVPHSSLRELVGSALMFYQTHDAGVSPVFLQSMQAFSSGASKIKKLCNSTEPCVWSLRLSTDKSENTIMWNFITSLASLALNVKSETSDTIAMPTSLRDEGAGFFVVRSSCSTFVC